MNKQEIGERFGVSAKTVQRWVARGCPHVRQQDGALDLEPDAVGQWLAQGGDRGEEPTAPAPSGNASKENLNRAELAQRIASARRTELEVQAEKGLRDSGLGERIRAARTFEDLGALTTEVAALLGEGALRPNRASALHKLLVERRLQLTQLAERHDEDPLSGKVLLCTAEVENVVRAFEALYSDERRARVVEFITAVLAEDMNEFAPTDTSPQAAVAAGS